MSASHTLAAVRRLFAAYGATASVERVKVYTEVLADLDPDRLTAGIEACLRACSRLPSIADVRRAVAEAACDLPDVDLAWGEVKRQVRCTGRYRVPTWSSPAIGAAVEGLGGWHAVCDADNEGVIRGQFARAYRASRTQRVEREQLGEAAALLGKVRKAAQLEGGGE